MNNVAFDLSLPSNPFTMKTKLQYLTFFLYVFFLTSLQATTVEIPATVEWVRQVNTLSRGQAVQVYNTLQVNLGAGDTLCFPSGTRSPIRFDDLRGDSLQPIVVTHKEGRVTITKPNGGYYGITFNGCRYMKVSGKRIPSIAYGIQITGIPSGSAFSINNFSCNFEVEGVEISRIYSAGFVAKTDPSCANLSTYPSFVMYDLRFHHNYVHHVGNEGFYIGNTSYNEGQGSRLSCTNPSFTGNVLPHKIIGVRIYENVVDSSGWDGIQVAASDKAEIFDNVVRYDSYADVVNQMSGIFIGQPGSANVYRNIIQYGKGSGIQCFGVGCSIYNNLIIHPANSNVVRGYYNSSGQLVNSTFTYGVYINDKVCVDLTVPRLPYLVAHNTIVIDHTYRVGSPYNTFAPQGINLNSLNYISGSVVSSNLVVIDSNLSATITSPVIGIYSSNSVPGYSTSYSPSFISMNSRSVFGPNFYSNEPDAVGFLNRQQADYSLNWSSSAIDAAPGSLITSNSFLNKDFLGATRPQGAMPDFGALETAPAGLSQSISGLLVVPNPISLSGGMQTFSAMLNDTATLLSPAFELAGPYLVNGPVSISIAGESVVNGRRVFQLGATQLPAQPGTYSLLLKSEGVLKSWAGLLLVP